MLRVPNRYIFLIAVIAFGCQRASPDRERGEERSTFISKVVRLGRRLTSQYNEADFEPITQLQTLDGKGNRRLFEVIVPNASSPNNGFALTFVFHGANGSPRDARALKLHLARDARNKSIFVFPAGVQYEDAGVGWDDRCSGYDMPFFDNMLKELRTRYAFDEKRIFVAGFSWGADFATALLCCRGQNIRAAAVASCTDEFKNSKNFRSYFNYPCPQTGATAIRFTFDAKGDTAYSKDQFDTTLELYTHLNNCDETKADAGHSCQRFSNCRAPVVACGYSSIGHSVPPAWADESWFFFESLQTDANDRIGREADRQLQQ
jgi:poly(3-hydroxybutyrate) depolymerase